VLVNLLSNASKYGPTQQEILIEVIPADDDWLKVSVTDHGPGIPSQEHGKIFQQYYRLGAKSSAQMEWGWDCGGPCNHRTARWLVGVEEAPEGGSKFLVHDSSAR